MLHKEKTIELAHNYDIALTTQEDVNEFINAVKTVTGKIQLRGNDGLVECSCNARSLLGVMYAMLWDNLSAHSEVDIYRLIEKFVR